MGPIMLSFQVYESVRVALHNVQFKIILNLTLEPWCNSSFHPLSARLTMPIYGSNSRPLGLLCAWDNHVTKSALTNIIESQMQKRYHFTSFYKYNSIRYS